VIVTAFLDYQSERTALAFPAVRKAVSDAVEGGSRIELVLHDYPFDSKCNDVQHLHAWACAAAASVKLMNERRGAPAAMELGEWILEQRATITGPLITKRLNELGLGDTFEQEYPRLERAVRTDAEFGTQLGIRLVPAIFVDGVSTPISFLPTAIRNRVGHLKR
jgi:protein-disulfide isomerase